jgi:hypothetical protein
MSDKPIKLKSLVEGYAWERKPGKPLPTLSEVQAEHERNLQEETEYKVSGRPVKLNKNGSEKQADWSVTFENGKTAQYHEVASLISPRPKLQPRWWDSDGDGKPYEKGDDVKAENINEAGNYYGQYNRKRNAAADEYRPNSGAPEPAPEEWDEIMDKVNNDPDYKVHSDTVLKIIHNLKTDAVYRISWRSGKWEGRDMETRQIVPVEEVIAKAKADVFGGDVNLGENMRRFGTKNI